MQSVLAKVQASPYAGPFFSEDRFDARLKVTLRDGRVLEAKVDSPLGRTADDPIPTEALNAKFRDCAGRILAPQQSEAVCKQVWAVEALRNVSELTAMLETSAGRRLEAAA